MCQGPSCRDHQHDVAATARDVSSDVRQAAVLWSAGIIFSVRTNNRPLVRLFQLHHGAAKRPSITPARGSGLLAPPVGSGAEPGCRDSSVHFVVPFLVNFMQRFLVAADGGGSVEDIESPLAVGLDKSWAVLNISTLRAFFFDIFWFACIICSYLGDIIKYISCALCAILYSCFLMHLVGHLPSDGYRVYTKGKPLSSFNYRIKH